jgi:DNA-directed RNA polymerase specialized sigma24 family protein
MGTIEEAKCEVVDLYWLSTLLTGCREIACDVTVQSLSLVEGAGTFFSSWMEGWSRRSFIAKALAALREELAESARRTVFRAVENSELPARSWTLDDETTKSDLERALLSIDVFPRAAVLLLLFERVPMNDAATLLDSAPDLVRKALAIGARELMVNLAKLQGWKSGATGSSPNYEDHRVESTEAPS